MRGLVGHRQRCWWGTGLRKTSWGKRPELGWWRREAVSGRKEQGRGTGMGAPDGPHRGCHRHGAHWGGRKHWWHWARPDGIGLERASWVVHVQKNQDGVTCPSSMEVKLSCCQFMIHYVKIAHGFFNKFVLYWDEYIPWRDYREITLGNLLRTQWGVGSGERERYRLQLRVLRSLIGHTLSSRWAVMRVVFPWLLPFLWNCFSQREL